MPPDHYPPDGFECLYLHTCPYLDGLSTTWVMGEYQRAGDEYQQHLRIVDNFRKDSDIKNERILILERENAELKAKLLAVHQRQFKSNKKTGEENINCAAAPMKSKKRGAPAGHPGWTRPRPNRVDHTVDVPAPAICPHCKSDNLAPMEESAEHFQEDIVIRPRTVITRYLHGQAFCARCNRRVVQAGEGEILNAAIGPVAKSAGIYLRYRMGLSYIDRHRSAGAAKSIFGEKFEGTLVRDRYAAYNGIGKDWQSCIAHILTKAKEISREHALLPDTEKDAFTGPFCERVMDFCSQLCDLGQKLKTGAVRWNEAAKIEKRFAGKFSRICRQPLRFKAAETLRVYLAGPEQRHLFTFLRIP